MKKVLVLVAVVQAALVAVGVAPQLSAMATGEEYRMLVRPVDPIDPFRGAYVDLDYPGLRRAGLPEDGSGPVFVTLQERNGLWRMDETLERRPAQGPYLACVDTGRSVECGIESWFTDQAEARRLEQALADEGAVATVKVDADGNAVIVALDPR
jgi:uncharacterized membrane-anchored protein